MHEPLPWEVLLAELPDGFHYQLPPRQLGRLRFGGLFLILSGLTGGLLLVALAWACGPWLAPPAGAPPWLLSLALTLAVLGVAHAAVRLGFLVCCGHSQIHLRHGRLTALEYAGLFLRRRSQPWAAVRRLTVTALPRLRLNAILAECDGGRRLWLAPGYPVRILTPLAHDLARRCAQLAGVAAIPVEQAAPLPEPPAFDDRAIEQERSEPPPGSRVRVEERGGGVTVVVPPAGVWRGNRGLVTFALLWCAALAGLTALAWFAAAGPLAGSRGVLAGLLGSHAAVGVLLLVLAVVRGRRAAVLTVADEALVVEQTGLFRGERQEWLTDELVEIVVGPSFRRDHDTPVLELKIWEFPGHFTGLLAGRDPAELAFVATRLRHALDLPPPVAATPRLYEGPAWSSGEPPAEDSWRRAS